MISFDTNVLLPAVHAGAPGHQSAAEFLRSLQERDDVAVSEFVLLELYLLLRNPVSGSGIRSLESSSRSRPSRSCRPRSRWARRTLARADHLA